MTDDRRLEVETARRPAMGVSFGGDLPVAPRIDPAVIRSRRRIIRLIGLLTILGGIGLSVIPGPKGSANTTTNVTEGGVTTTTHKFSYYRPYGVPFVVARVELPDEGRGIKSFEMNGDNTVGFFGNLMVAFGLAIGVSVLLRRRREP